MAGITIDINAKITGYEASLAQMKKDFAKIDPGSDIGKKLGKAIQNADSQLSSLQKNATKKVTSESQLDSFLEKTNQVGTAINTVAELMQRVTSQDINFSSFDSGITQLTQKLSELENQLSGNISSGFREAITGSNELSQAFKNLNIDITDKTPDQIFKAISESASQAAKDTETAEKALQSAQQTLTNKQTELANLKSNPIANRDALKENLETLKTNYTQAAETTLAEIKEKISAGITGLLGDNETSEKLKQAFEKDLSPDTLREHLKTLKDAIQDELSTKTSAKDIYTQLLGDVGNGGNAQAIATSLLSNVNKIKGEFINKVKELSTQFTDKETGKTFTLIDEGFLEEALQATLAAADRVYEKLKGQMTKKEQEVFEARKNVDNAQTNVTNAQAKEGTLATINTDLESKYQAVLEDNARLWDEVKSLKALIENKKEEHTNNIRNTGRTAEEKTKDFQVSTREANQYRTALEQVQAKEKMIGKLEGVVQRWFSIYAVIRTVNKAIRSVISTVKELDKTITEIAIVTNMSQDQLWGQMSTYTDMAREYAASIAGVYKVSQLYYQQGLQTADVMALTEQTLKMARISGLEYSQATNYMTNAVRSFKMEMTDAQRVVDVYSQIAANSATSVSELATAMSKTASSAESVGSSFESTTAMMAVMIEATRESAENIGSALKSIISRYGEMKSDPTKLVDSEGEEMSLNKVDTALRSVGISIKNAQGQFRDFDDVITELAGKWDTIDKNTQRYIATIMAGNRQQSRFLALVSNGERLTELTKEAANSEDASQLQMLKTMDSIEAKSQQLKTSLQSLYTSSGVQNLFKGFLDQGNEIVKTFTKMPTIMNLPIPAIIKIGTTFASLANVVTTVFGLIKAKTQAQISALRGIEQTGMQERIAIALQEAAQKDIIRLQENIAKEKQLTGLNEEEQIRSQERIAIWQKELEIKRNIANTPIGTPGQGRATGGITKSQAGLSLGLNMAGVVVSTVAGSMSEKNRIAKGLMGTAGSGLSMAGMGAMIGSSAGPWGAVIGGALGVLMGLIENANYLFESASAKAKRLKEEATEANNTFLQARSEYTGTRDEIQSLQELAKARYNSKEANEEFIESCNKIAEQHPELVTAYDDEGNAILDLASTYDILADAREKAMDAGIEAGKKSIEAAYSARDAAEKNREKNIDEKATGVFDFSYAVLGKDREFIKQSVIGGLLKNIYEWGFSSDLVQKIEREGQDYYQFKGDQQELEELVDFILSGGTIENFLKYHPESSFNQRDIKSILEKLFTTYQTATDNQAVQSGSSGSVITTDWELLDLLTTGENGIDLEDGITSYLEEMRSAYISHDWDTLRDLTKQHAPELAKLRQDLQYQYGGLFDHFFTGLETISGIVIKEDADIQKHNAKIELEERSRLAAITRGYIDASKDNPEENSKIFDEMQGVSELISNYMYSQFQAFKEKFKREGGKEGDAWEEFVKSTDILEDYNFITEYLTNLWKNLTKTGKEKLNAVLQNSGRYSRSQFDAALLEAGIDVDEIREAIVEQYYASAYSKLDFYQAIGQRSRNQKIQLLSAKHNYIINQMGSDELLHSLEVYDNIASQIENNQISEQTGQRILNSYFNMWEKTGDIVDDTMRETAQGLLMSFDDFSLSGFEKFKKQVEESGLDEESQKTLINAAQAMINLVPKNLNSEIQSFVDSVTSNLENFEKALSNAAKGMDLKTAMEMAQKIGVDISEFTFSGGKFFYTGFEAIQQAYMGQRDEWLESLKQAVKEERLTTQNFFSTPYYDAASGQLLGKGFSLGTQIDENTDLITLRKALETQEKYQSDYFTSQGITIDQIMGYAQAYQEATKDEKTGKEVKQKGFVAWLTQDYFKQMLENGEVVIDTYLQDIVARTVLANGYLTEFITTMAGGDEDKITEYQELFNEGDIEAIIARFPQFANEITQYYASINKNIYDKIIAGITDGGYLTADATNAERLQELADEDHKFLELVSPGDEESGIGAVYKMVVEDSEDFYTALISEIENDKTLSEADKRKLLSSVHSKKYETNAYDAFKAVVDSFDGFSYEAGQKLLQAAHIEATDENLQIWFDTDAAGNLVATRNDLISLLALSGLDQTSKQYLELRAKLEAQDRKLSDDTAITEIVKNRQKLSEENVASLAELLGITYDEALTIVHKNADGTHAIRLDKLVDVLNQRGVQLSDAVIDLIAEQIDELISAVTGLAGSQSKGFTDLKSMQAYVTSLREQGIKINGEEASLGALFEYNKNLRAYQLTSDGIIANIAASSIQLERLRGELENTTDEDKRKDLEEQIAVAEQLINTSISEFADAIDISGFISLDVGDPARAIKEKELRKAIEDYNAALEAAGETVRLDAEGIIKNLEEGGEAAVATMSVIAARQNKTLTADDILSAYRAKVESILSEVKSLSGAKGGDWINLTQLMNQLSQGFVYEGSQKITLGEQLTAKIQKYGGYIEDGILKLEAGANIPAIIQEIATTAAESGGLLTSEMAELADTLNEVLQTYAELIRNGINGSLTNVQAQQLQKWGQSLNIDIDFTRTKDGLKIATDSALELYEALKRIDSIQADLVFEDLVTALSEDKGGKFETISKTTAEIAKIRKEILANSLEITRLTVEDAENNADKIAALQKQNDKLHDQLSLYNQIAQRQSIDPSQYNFMDRELPNVLQGPINYWNSVGQAFSVMKEAGQNGKMEIQDFYNIVTEMNNLVNLSGQKITLAGVTLDGSAEAAAALITKGMGALTNIDGKGVKINLEELGIDFYSGAEGAKENFAKGVNKLADAQIAMLDAAIKVLEVVVAMEDLGSIDANENNKLDLGEIFKLDPSSNVPIGWDEDYRDAVKLLLKKAEKDQELKEALETVKINGSSVYDLLSDVNLSFADATKRWEELGLSAEKYQQIMSGLYQAFAKGDYNLDTIQDSVWETLAQYMPDGIVIELPDRTIVVNGTDKVVIDWEKPEVDEAVKAWAKEHKVEEEIAKQQLGELVAKYQNNESLKPEEVVYVLSVLGYLKIDYKTGDIVDEDGNHLKPGTFDYNEAIAKAALRKAGIDEKKIDQIEYDGETKGVKVHATTKIGKTEIEVYADENGDLHFISKQTGGTYDSLEELQNAEIEQLMQQTNEATGTNYTYAEAYEALYHVKYTPSVIVDADLSDPAQRDKAKEAIAEGEKAVIEKFTNDDENDGYTYEISADKETITFDFNGVKVTTKNTGNVEEDAKTAFEGLSTQIGQQLQGQITQAIIDAFSDGTIAESIGTALVTALTGANLDGKEFTIPNITATIANLNIASVDHVGFGRVGGNIGTFLNGSKNFLGGSDLTIESATAKLANLVITGADSVDVSQVETIAQQIIDTIQEYLNSHPLTFNFDNGNNGENPEQESEPQGSSDNGSQTGAAQSVEQAPATPLAVTFDTSTLETQIGTLTTAAGEAAGKVSELATGLSGLSDLSQITDAAKAISDISSDAAQGVVDILEDISSDSAQSAQDAINKIDEKNAQNAQNAINNISPNQAQIAASYIRNIDPSGAQGARNAINQIKAPTSLSTKFSVSLSSAKGNVALAKGRGRARAGGQNTLMGELGPELVVSNGRYFVVGQNGPEMVDLAPDAIVFNHLQTKQLLANGKTSTYATPVTNERKAVAFAEGNVEEVTTTTTNISQLNDISSTVNSILRALNVISATCAAILQKPVSNTNVISYYGGGGGSISTNFANRVQRDISNKVPLANKTSATNKIHYNRISGYTKAKGTLMGELGPELVVSNGQYFLVGENGAEFIDLDKDAIVFNHLQTKRLIKQGAINGRGQPFISEEAAVSYAKGKYPSFGFAHADDPGDTSTTADTPEPQKVKSITATPTQWYMYWLNGNVRTAGGVSSKSFAKGNISGPAMSSASEALAALLQLRAMWESLRNASLKDMGGMPGGSGGGGGGGGGGNAGKIVEGITANVERWYNWLKLIESTQNKINILTKQYTLLDKYGMSQAQKLANLREQYQKQLSNYNTRQQLVIEQTNYRTNLIKKANKGLMSAFYHADPETGQVYLSNDEAFAKYVKSQKGNSLFTGKTVKAGTTLKYNQKQREANFNEQFAETLSEEEYKKLSKKEQKYYSYDKKKKQATRKKYTKVSSQYKDDYGSFKIKSNIKTGLDFLNELQAKDSAGNLVHDAKQQLKLIEAMGLKTDDLMAGVDTSQEGWEATAVQNFFDKIEADKTEIEALNQSIQEQQEAALEDAAAMAEINQQIIDMHKPLAGLSKLLDEFQTTLRKISDIQTKLNKLNKENAILQNDFLANGKKIGQNWRDQASAALDQIRANEELIKQRQQEYDETWGKISNIGVKNGNKIFTRDKETNSVIYGSLFDKDQTIKVTQRDKLKLNDEGYAQDQYGRYVDNKGILRDENGKEIDTSVVEAATKALNARKDYETYGKTITENKKYKNTKIKTGQKIKINGKNVTDAETYKYGKNTYAKVGNTYYKQNAKGEWVKTSDKAAQTVYKGAKAYQDAVKGQNRIYQKKDGAETFSYNGEKYQYKKDKYSKWNSETKKWEAVDDKNTKEALAKYLGTIKTGFTEKGYYYDTDGNIRQATKKAGKWVKTDTDLTVKGASEPVELGEVQTTTPSEKKPFEIKAGDTLADVVKKLSEKDEYGNPKYDTNEAWQIIEALGLTDYFLRDENGEEIYDRSGELTEEEKDKMLNAGFNRFNQEMETANSALDEMNKAQAENLDLQKEILDIRKQIEDLTNDWENVVKEAMVQEHQDAINNKKELKDAISNAASKTVEGMRSALEKEKNLYNIENSEDELDQMRNRLAALRNSNGSASEIRDLEKQIQEKEKSLYFDKREQLIDDFETDINNQMDALQAQIDLQQAILDHQVKYGELWDDIYEILKGTPEQIADYVAKNNESYWGQSARQQEQQTTAWVEQGQTVQEGGVTQEQLAYVRAEVKRQNKEASEAEIYAIAAKAATSYSEALAAGGDAQGKANKTIQSEVKQLADLPQEPEPTTTTTTASVTTTEPPEEEVPEVPETALQPLSEQMVTALLQQASEKLTSSPATDAAEKPIRPANADKPAQAVELTQKEKDENAFIESLKIKNDTNKKVEKAIRKKYKELRNQGKTNKAAQKEIKAFMVNEFRDFQTKKGAVYTDKNNKKQTRQSDYLFKTKSDKQVVHYDPDKKIVTLSTGAKYKIQSGKAYFKYFPASVIPKFAQGGSIDFTGPAWVDGTKSKPEHIFNYEQMEELRNHLLYNVNATSQAIAGLSSILDSLPDANTYNNINTASNNGVSIDNIDFHMEVKEIANDYDAKKAAQVAMDEMVRIARKAGNRSVIRR